MHASTHIISDDKILGGGVWSLICSHHHKLCLHFFLLSTSAWVIIPLTWVLIAIVHSNWWWQPIQIPYKLKFGPNFLGTSLEHQLVSGYHFLMVGGTTTTITTAFLGGWIYSSTECIMTMWEEWPTHDWPKHDHLWQEGYVQKFVSIFLIK